MTIQIPFRDFHLIQLLEAYDWNLGPFDVYLANYFRANKQLGSKDRREISETAYGLIRWLGLVDYLMGEPHSWERRVKEFRKLTPSSYRENARIPLNDRYSFPRVLFDRLVQSHGEERACEIAWASNSPAPVTIRTNLLKIGREDLMVRLRRYCEVRACAQSEEGIVLSERIHCPTMEEFQAGLFEMQDEASQLVASRVAAKPGQHLLDFCAGAGGKSLAIAARMQNRGQVYLHDIRFKALQEAQKRLRRAGVQNAQTILAGDAKLAKIQGHMHWVLVDAPCSSTGTLRRSPDLKWKFKPEVLEGLVQTQRNLVTKAIPYLKPRVGRLVYATCSVLAEENQQQVDWMLANLPVRLESPPFQTFPSEQGMDGFFSAIFGIV